MEYQILYSGGVFNRGTLSVDNHILRLRGYTAARQRNSIFLTSWVMWLIWFILWQKSPVRIHLGLSSDGELWAEFVAMGVALAPLILALLLVWLWPTSTTTEDYERRFVTHIERRGKKVSFDLPNPVKPGKFLHVKFKPKSIEEAEQIVEVLLEGQKIASAVSIPPDVEKDILSGQLSKQEIMMKYAIRAEELEEMYKILAAKE
jgi:hypothetical protein